MTNFDFLDTVHRELLRLRTARPDDVELANLTAEAFARRNQAMHADAVPLVFRMPMPGFIELGTLGSTFVVPNPQLAGLRDAWQIIAAGLDGNAYLRPQDFMDGSSPAPALRNRLSAAATWLEPHCRDLASLLRSPTLKVEDERIRFFSKRHVICA